MASYHTVAQGEYLSRIANQYGFSDYRTIWNHGQNAELRQKRLNPNVLFPGDRLFHCFGAHSPAVVASSLS